MLGAYGVAAGSQATSAQRPRLSRTWLPVTVLFVPATLCDGTRECVRCQSAQPGGARLAVSSSRRLRRTWTLLPFRLPLVEEFVLKLPLPLPTLLGVTTALPEASVNVGPPTRLLLCGRCE